MVKGGEQVFQLVKVEGINVGVGDDYNVFGGGAVVDVEGVVKGEFFWGDIEDFYWVVGGDGNCGIGGVGVNYNNFLICECLLNNVIEEGIYVLFFVVIVDDQGVFSYVFSKFFGFWCQVNIIWGLGIEFLK